MLDKKLTQVFVNPKSVIVGFSFNHDIDMFVRKFPKMKFYRFIKNFIDAQTYYARVFLTTPEIGLAKVAERVLGKPLCKREQMSNWERRPLRLSQQHYAAMDAYVLVQVIQKLGEKGQKDGHPIKNHVITLDKRLYTPKDEEEEKYDDDEDEAPKQVTINSKQQTMTQQRQQQNYQKQPYKSQQQNSHSNN